MNNLEKLLYAPFGNNIIIGPHIKDQLNFLKEILPEEFKEREMYDLGCGDGKVTILLKEIFHPKKVFACDAENSLVKKAKKKGIEAKIVDLEKEIPEGELAVMWGVLHHLKNPKETLERIKNNFQFFFLREPLKKEGRGSELKISNILELGRPFHREEIKKMLDEVFGNNYQVFERSGAIMVLWEKEKKLVLKNNKF